MPVHRIAAWTAPPVIAALAIPLIAGLASGAAPTRDAAPASSWADPVALAACGDGPGITTRAPSGQMPAAGSSASAAGARGGVHGGFSLEPVLGTSGSLEGWRLVTSVPGSPAASVQLPPESTVRGPVEGRVVVAADNGKRSRITIAALGGCAARVLEWPDVVRQAVLRPGSGAVLFHAVRRADRSDLGVWSFVPGDDSAPARVVPPLAPEDPIVAEVGRIWATSLMLDDSGRWLAVQSCGEEACGARIVDLQTREIRRPLGAHQGDLVGLDAHWAIGYRPCPGRPCELVATSLADGRERVLSHAASAATTATVGDRFVVAAVVLDRGQPELQVIDPANGLIRHLGPAAPDLVLLPAGGSSGAGIGAASGWVGAVRLRDGTPTTLNLDGLLAPSEGPR